MTAFKVALTAEKGSLITDGTYTFKDNAVEDSHGIYLAGTVKGTSKDKLKITADDKCNTGFYADGITFENATINVKSQIRTWFDAYDLTLKNSSLTVAGFGMSYYVNKLNMDNSEFVINKIGWRHSTGLTIQGDSTVTNNSRIVANAGSTAGISVGISNGKLAVTNSTLEFNNGGAGGLNVNSGKVILTNSTIKGDGKNSGALFGAQNSGSIELKGDCLIDSPANKNADGGAGTGNNYVVTGGSHMVTYAPDYHSNKGSTVPVNGEENGNERLSLFTLADSSVNEIKPINKNGNAYIYSVKKASKDNEKHVWVPAAKVTFELNDTKAEDSKKAKGAIFSDSSTKAKESLAIRGYALNFAKTVAGGSTEVPANPIAPGYKFLGWFCKNAQHSEQKFTEKMIIKSDTTVYAKWEKDSSSYAVRYHNCAQDDATYIVSETSPKRTSKVLSFYEVVKNNAKFARKGMVFKGWTTDKNGKGKTVKAGSNISISQSENLIDLYANWEEKEFTVKFSANGGTFSNNSIFKTNTKVFEIKKDKRGGDVAVVKKTAKFSKNRTLINLIKSLDDNVNIDTTGISGKADSDSDTTYTNLATRKYYTLKNKDESYSIFGITIGSYYYWFKDKNGTEKASIDNNLRVNDDLTFYLKWEINPNVKQIQQEDINLPADLLTGENTATTAYKVTPGQTIDFTGTITASVVKDQMKTIEKKFNTVNAKDYDKITLEDMTSSFMATFTIPDGLTLPENITKNTLKLDGFSDTFAIQDVQVKDKTVTVTINLKSGITTYAALQTAVQTNLGDAMKITIPGIKINQDFSGKATIVGTVSGSFHAAATFNGTTKLFDFTWNGSQTNDGKNSDAAAGANDISLTVEYDPQTPPTPPT
ncbi:InlB B-repeat-containing protein, partial [Gardnerella vaginalis]|uniref:InlB B-repeat-containing protein n=1 Tax=Gardnerella vaginalis TaxID=2702 RepID=UPI0003528409